MAKAAENTSKPMTEYSRPTKGAGGKTGLWRTFKPVIVCEKCKKCMICWEFCPDAAISKGEDGYPKVDYTYCKGCGICSRECRFKAIEMSRESE